MGSIEEQFTVVQFQLDQLEAEAVSWVKQHFEEFGPKFLIGLGDRLLIEDLDAVSDSLYPGICKLAHFGLATALLKVSEQKKNELLGA